MPICPWPHLLVFSFGAGASLLVVALIGGVAYNGTFGDDNKFKKYTYGFDEKIGKITVANVSCGVFTIVLIGVAIGFNILHLPKGALIIAWVLADLAFVGTVVCQSLSIYWTRFGDDTFWGNPLKSRHNYYKDKEFKEYVDKYYGDQMGSSSGRGCKELTFEWLPEEGTMVDMTTNETINITYPIHLADEGYMNDFWVPFYKDDQCYSVPQCTINWNASTIMGVDPCNFQLSAYKCIGEWSAENFRNYWCYAYRSNRTDTKDRQGKSEIDQLKDSLENQREVFSVDSYSAFYELNAIFLGLECAGFFITQIALILVAIIKPFDKENIHFKKIEASGSSGSAAPSTKDTKKNKKKGKK